MALQYTKKEKDETAEERVIPAEEFVNLMVSSQRISDNKQELPKTEILK